MKTILITGGSGFIGQHLVAYFQKQGYTVFAPSHRELDLEIKDFVGEYLHAHPVDYVIHTALPSAPTMIYPVFANLQQSLPNKVMCFNLGSGAEYSKYLPLTNVPETYSIRCLQDLTFEYGEQKRAISAKIQSLSNWYNLRLFGVFGQGELSTRFISEQFGHYLKREPMFVREDKLFSYIWVEDLCNAIHWLMESPPRHHVLNLVDKSIRLSEICAKINEIGEWVVPIVINTDGDDYSGDGTLFLKETQHMFKWTPFREALRIFWQQYKESNHVKL